MGERSGVWIWNLAAIVLFCTMSWAYLDHGASLTRDILGTTTDPTLMIWFLAWWPSAVLHHAVHWYTYLVWQPVGQNLAWTTSVPLLALLGLPATLLGGPALAYNLLILGAPVLGALSAYFLCLDLFTAPLAALTGGGVFGFSSFEAAQSLNHLDLAFTAFIPLIVMAVLRRVAGRIGRGPFVLWLCFLIAGQFFVAYEVLATLCMFGAIAFLLRLWMLPERRDALRALEQDICCAAPVVALLTALILLGILRGCDAPHPEEWPFTFSADLLKFFLRTRASLVGYFWPLRLVNKFSGGLEEQTAYVGLPSLVLLFVVLWGVRRKREFCLLFLMLGIILLAILGPELQIGGNETGIFLPWLFVMHLPLICNALPGRCMVFAALVMAMVIAGWVADVPHWRRVLVGGIVLISLLPAPHAVMKRPSLTAFEPGRIEQVTGQHPRLLILPFGSEGASSYWQTENNLGFTQVGGYLGFLPARMPAYPVVWDLYSPIPRTDFASRFVEFCQQTGTQYVVVGPGTFSWQSTALAGLGWRQERVDGVTLFAVPDAAHG